MGMARAAEAGPFARIAACSIISLTCLRRQGATGGKYRGFPCGLETDFRAGSGPAASMWSRPSVRLLGVAVVVGLAAIGLRGRLPSLRGVLDALAGADYGWVLLAALLQFASIGAFALQQQRLLQRMGVYLRRRYAFAIILATTALSISMPAGPAVATGFTIRKYQRGGATREVAAAAVVVSGLASIGGLALLYLGGGLASRDRRSSP